MNNVVYASDALLSDIVGGGELNDYELCLELQNRGLNITKLRSSQLSVGHISTNSFYIISNFVMLNNRVIEKIQNTCKYMIYEHDHKYLKNRNPAIFKDYKAPDNIIINEEFYKKAKAVFCQSSFHESIIKKNLNLHNVYNVSGNLWSIDSLMTMRELSKKQKKDLLKPDMVDIIRIMTYMMPDLVTLEAVMAVVGVNNGVFCSKMD